MPIYNGIPWDVMLQGFHWHSHDAAKNGKAWYRVLRECAPRIKEAGFTWVWFPPPSDSLAPEGYMPRRWFEFNTRYGTERELRDAIAALAPEVRALADVVVNHRVGTSGLTDFTDPAFGPGPEDNRRAIVQDDSTGTGQGRPDTGEGEVSSRDLDHTNPKVREKIVEYQQRLLDLGFRGWRYDLVKGYRGRYVAEFNAATLAEGEISVGEFLDGDTAKVLHWLQDQGHDSMVFDYPLRFVLHDAIRRDDFTSLRQPATGGRPLPGLIGHLPQLAVTFLDNHDTEYRRGRNEHFYGSDVGVGHAYLLTHPGLPCVFWSHFFDWDEATESAIAALMKLRAEAYLSCNSNVEILEARPHLYAALVDKQVAVRLGSDQGWNPGQGWTSVWEGDRFAVWKRS